MITQEDLDTLTELKQEIENSLKEVSDILENAGGRVESKARKNWLDRMTAAVGLDSPATLNGTFQDTIDDLQSKIGDDDSDDDEEDDDDLDEEDDDYDDE